MAQRIVDVFMTIDDAPSHRLLRREPQPGDQVTMTGRLEPSGHDIALLVEYRQSAYRVIEVTVRAHGHDTELTSATLGMPVKEAAEGMLTHVWARTASDNAEAVGDFQRRQRRRWLDDDFLRLVAEAYRAAEGSGVKSVIDAVANAPGIGPAGYSSAQRWVAAARERGLLPAARPGKRKG